MFRRDRVRKCTMSFLGSSSVGSQMPRSFPLMSLKTTIVPVRPAISLAYEARCYIDTWPEFVLDVFDTTGMRKSMLGSRATEPRPRCQTPSCSWRSLGSCFLVSFTYVSILSSSWSSLVPTMEHLNMGIRLRDALSRNLQRDPAPYRALHLRRGGKYAKHSPTFH